MGFTSRSPTKFSHQISEKDHLVALVGRGRIIIMK